MHNKTRSCDNQKTCGHHLVIDGGAPVMQRQLDEHSIFSRDNLNACAISRPRRTLARSTGSPVAGWQPAAQPKNYIRVQFLHSTSFCRRQRLTRARNAVRRSRGPTACCTTCCARTTKRQGTPSARWRSWPRAAPSCWRVSAVCSVHWTCIMLLPIVVMSLSR